MDTAADQKIRVLVVDDEAAFEPVCARSAENSDDQAAADMETLLRELGSAGADRGPGFGGG